MLGGPYVVGGILREPNNIGPFRRESRLIHEEQD